MKEYLGIERVNENFLSNALSKPPVLPLVPVASPPSPTVVNAEITKLAINDDAPRTRATTPETVGSNRAPSVVPSTASTANQNMTPPTLRPRSNNGTSRARKPSGSVPHLPAEEQFNRSKDAPDAIPLLSPVPQHDRNIFLESPPSETLEFLPEGPSANELSLNSHWKQYLLAVHEQCVVGFQSNIKLHDMMFRQFRKITAHEAHRAHLEDYSLAEIKIRLSDVGNKLDQLNVVIPQTHADMSGQISRV
ncbi:hypothetical protein KEM48_009124 [Puccinia striiformis f. sp. tritici PST-130]|nr:hypothetical protein KEM48_009124 [Puccinia striiformis f. sp. tritici PST-130]